MRRQCFEAHRYEHPLTGRTVMDCHCCGGVVDPAAGDAWEAEHCLPRNCGGGDDSKNVLPAHLACSRAKTSQEATVRNKTKRTADQLYGIKRSERPMPGSKASGWKHKMDGSWERR